MSFLKRNAAFFLAAVEMILLAVALYVVKNIVFTVVLVGVIVVVAGIIFSKVLPKISEARAEIERCITNEKEVAFDKEGLYQSYLLFFSPFWVLVFLFLQLDPLAAVIVSIPLLLTLLGYFNKVKVTWTAANFPSRLYWGIQGIVLLVDIVASVVLHLTLGA